MNLRVLALMPIIMMTLWLVVATILFSFSISGDRDLYDEVFEDITSGVQYLPLSIPPPLSQISTLPVALSFWGRQKKTEDYSLDTPPLPPVVSLPAITYLDPPPPIWILQDMAVVQNDQFAFEARFRYYGGRLGSTITYQAFKRQPSVWIIDLPAEWVHRLDNNYRWPKGLIQRVALGLHNGYLRLVLYLRHPHGGREIVPLVVVEDHQTFTIILEGPAAKMDYFS